MWMGFGQQNPDDCKTVTVRGGARAPAVMLWSSLIASRRQDAVSVSNVSPGWDGEFLPPFEAQAVCRGAFPPTAENTESTTKDNDDTQSVPGPVVRRGGRLFSDLDAVRRDHRIVQSPVLHLPAGSVPSAHSFTVLACAPARRLLDVATVGGRRIESLEK